MADSYTITSPTGESYTISPPETAQPSTMDSVKSAVSSVGEAVSNPRQTLAKVGQATDTLGSKSELGGIPNMDTAKALVKSPIYGAMNLYDSAKGIANTYDKGDEDYSQSATHQNIDTANQMHQQELNQTPYGQTADFAGQLATPVPEINIVGKAAKTAGAMTKLGKGVGRGVEHVAEGATTGAIFSGEQAKPQTNNSEDLANQAEGDLATGAAAGGAINAVTGSLGKAGSWFKQGLDWMKGGVADAKKEVGKQLINDQNRATVEAHVNNPNAKNMPLTDVTQDRGIGGIEKSVFTGKEKDTLQEQRHGVNQQLAGELNSLNVSGTNHVLPATENKVGTEQANITRQFAPASKETNPAVENAITPVQAQEKTGAMARDVSNTERQAIKDSYTAIAPDDTVQAPLEDLQHNMDAIREEHNISEDSTLSEIDDRYSSENETNTAPVKQIIQDKNALGDYINNQYRMLKNPNAVIDADTSKSIKDSIEAATKMRDALKDHLNGLTDIPSGVEGMSVSEAFQEAEGKYKEYNQKYLENPEQYKTNAQGQKYGFSSSAFGDYDYRLQQGSAGTLASEGKKLLPIENPDELGAALKNMRNVPESDGLVKTNLLANIKDKGFEKTMTPEVQAQLASNGFGNVSKEILDANKVMESKNYTIEQRNKYLDGIRQDEQDKLEKSFAGKVVKGGDVSKLLEDKQMQAEAIDLANKQNDNGATLRGLGKTILDKIKADTLDTAPNKMGGGEVTLANYEKFYDGFNKHKDILQKTLPEDQFKALETLNKELAENTFMARANANVDREATGADLPDKVKEVAIKGIINKIGGVPIGAAASAVAAMRGVTTKRLEGVYREAISNPAKALEFEQAARAAPKDPSKFKQFIDFTYDKLPSRIAGAETPPVDVRQDKSNKQPLHIDVPNIHKEVEDVTKPQSNNSNFSLISDANAGELPNGNSKKNGEFQIADASKQTGMPPAYFNALEKAETGSTKNPDKASNTKSSAYGRSQFTEGTWNEVAKKYNLPQVTDKNRLTKDDPRSNPKYSRLAAGYYGADNADKLRPWIQSKLGRDTTIGDVYGTHLMGLAGFKQFMSASPNSPADKAVPMAAKNNKSLFYDENGKSFSIKQVYRNIEDRLLPSSPKQTPMTDGEPDQ